MMYIIGNKNNWKRWILILLIDALILLPARFYQSYSLSLFHVESNLSVNYLNFVDLFAIIILLFFAIRQRRITVYLKYPLNVFFIISCICLIGNLLTAEMSFAGETISKLNIVLCAYMIGFCILKEFSTKEVICLYMIPIIVLVSASFFLRGYMGYGTSNRVGSLGFGSNETAMFACMLILSSLLFKRLPQIFRVSLIVLSFACLLIVSSRRGLLIGVGVLTIYALYNVFIRKKNHGISSKTAVSIIITVIVLFALFVYMQERILYFIYHSPLMYRFLYAENAGNNFLNITDRISIYQFANKLIGQNLVFGTFGSDQALAQGIISHCHNIFIQFIATYGIIGGAILSIYFLYTALNCFKILRLKEYNIKEYFLFPVCFFVTYIIFDQFGYLLWNPKGLFWVVLSIALINSYSKKLPFVDETDTLNNNNNNITSL